MNEAELYGMEQHEIEELKERLSMFVRNLRAKGIEEYRFKDYLIAEELERGNIAVDLIEPGRVTRKAFLMIDRTGELLVRAKYRDQVKILSRELVLEELAAI